MSSVIFAHPDVEAYFHVVEGDPWTHRDRLGNAVVGWYEQGDVVLFEQTPLNLDLGFIRGLPVLHDVAHELKKLKFKHIATPLTAETFPNHMLFRLFPADLDTASRYRRGILQAASDLERFVAYTFPNYRVVAAGDCSWRLSETKDEGLHYDSYGSSESEAWHVRLFINLDDQPRVWNVSHKVTTWLKTLGAERAQHLLGLKLHPNLLNSCLNEMGLSPCFHRVEFAPMACWMVNSQIVAHEIVYGRRLLAHTFDIDEKTMDRPELNFVTQVRDTLRQLAKEE